MPNSISKKISIFKKPLKVLFVAAEAYPYAVAGGLGMVIFSLTRALKKIGVDCQIFMPKYGSIDEKKYKMEMILEGLKVPTGERREGESLICNIKRHISSESGVPVYFLEIME